jgi:hypothetical protein
MGIADCTVALRIDPYKAEAYSERGKAYFNEKRVTVVYVHIGQRYYN